MTCPNCGAAGADNRRFCGKCGTAISWASPASTPAEAPTAPTAPPPPPAGAGAPNPWGPPTAPAAQWGPPPALPPSPPPPSPPPGAPDPFAPPQLTPPADPNAWAAYGGPPPQYPPPYPAAYPGAPGGPPGAWPGYGYAPPRTNGLAIASLVLGLIGWAFCGVGSVVAIVLGFVARNQIKRSWGQQVGGGMATAGIVLGFIGASFWILAFILQIASLDR
jgi:Domain of unknown function (DUF4190)/zinc-ribbon domain